MGICGILIRFHVSCTINFTGSHNVFSALQITNPRIAISEFTFCCKVHVIVVRSFQVRELHLSLQTEKSSRTDLEMYVNVLNAQKATLAEETDRLRLQLKQGISFTLL